MVLPRIFLLVLSLGLVCSLAVGQSGSGAPASRRVSSLNVIVRAPKDAVVTREMFDLYDGGIQQEIETFSPLQTGSTMVLMVDNTINLKADAATVHKAAKALIDELYQDDQMMVVGYNETAEIIEETTGTLAKLQIATTKFTRKGFPKLFDAIVAVSDALAHQAKTGTQKLAVVLISDGYDSESQTKFAQALGALQNENIVLYAIAVPDRTHGALMRDKPKPPAVLEGLTNGTGGQVLPIEKAAEAAKIITEDLRNNWYRLTYQPTGMSGINSRRLLLISHKSDVVLRTKGMIPGRYDAIH